MDYTKGNPSNFPYPKFFRDIGWVDSGAGGDKLVWGGASHIV
jgi:hypothetical protein